MKPRSIRTLLMAVGVISVLPSSAVTADFHMPWNKMRAEYFSYVCLGSAPSFSTAEDRRTKRQSGEHARSILHPIESQMGLRENGDTCSCIVAYAGVNADDMLKTAQKVLVELYSKHLAADTQTSGNKITFQFGGENVDVTLTPATRRQQTWLIARATRAGDCPS